MFIELKYQNPVTGRTFHRFFHEKDIALARDYLDDAMACNYIILIWRLLPSLENQELITK